GHIQNAVGRMRKHEMGRACQPLVKIGSAAAGRTRAAPCLSRIERRRYRIIKRRVFDRNRLTAAYEWFPSLEFLECHIDPLLSQDTERIFKSFLMDQRSQIAGFTARHFQQREVWTGGIS